MIGSSVAGLADPPRRHLNARLAAMLGMAAAAALSAATARAQINPFGGYHENVACAAQQNDSGRARLLLINGANPGYRGRDAAGGATEGHRPAVIQAIKRAQNAKKS